MSLTSYIIIGAVALVSFIAGAAFNWWMSKPAKGLSDAEWARRYKEKNPWQPPSVVPPAISDEEAAQADRVNAGQRL